MQLLNPTTNVAVPTVTTYADVRFQLTNGPTPYPAPMDPSFDLHVTGGTANSTRLIPVDLEQTNTTDADCFGNADTIQKFGGPAVAAPATSSATGAGERDALRTNGVRHAVAEARRACRRPNMTPRCLAACEMCSVPIVTSVRRARRHPSP